VHEGNVDGALKTLEERRMLAILEKNIPYEINSVATQAFILAETGDVPRAVELFKTAISMAENADIHPDIKENLKLSAKTWKIYSLAINNQLDEARTEIENCRQQILQRQNPGEIKTMNCICGNFERICGNYEKSINYFAEANSESPYDWFCLARAYHGKGDKSKADEILKKIADLKQNSLELALVRNRALDEF
jgi:tetratricopeptide (TPR) repeat protein